MSSNEIRIGIVGVCGGWGRGQQMVRTINATAGCSVSAICDLDIDRLREVNSELGVPHVYADYHEMLDSGEVDAVFIATPMDLHAQQSIDALQRDIHVLCEVPAAVDMQQAKDVVAACAKSSAVYMMGENYIYMQNNLVVLEMIRKGMFGDLYYAEAEYVHGLRWLHEKTKWRRKWQVGINGVTYGTHCLGPVLTWMAGDRVARVSCVGSGHHYRDAAGRPYEMEDSCVMMCKTEAGGLIKIRNDLVSNGPGRTYLHLQGTSGVFDSDRRRNEIWLEDRCETQKDWRDIETFFDEFNSEVWKQYGDEANQHKHGGGDYIQMLDFVAAVRGERPNPIDVHRGMDMTLPGLVSQQSIAQDSAWLDVPDSRAWV